MSEARSVLRPKKPAPLDVARNLKAKNGDTHGSAGSLGTLGADHASPSQCSSATTPATRKLSVPGFTLIDDGHGPDDLLHLIVEIKGYRREDAKEKKATMDTYWVPGVNNLGTYGRWAFAEFTDIYEIESDFKAKVEKEFNEMIDAIAQQSVVLS